MDEQPQPAPPEAPASPEEENERIWARVDEVSRAFSPGVPITKKELFSGRVAQMDQILDVARQRGSHAVLFGERGVGKTSLAAVVSGFLAAVMNRITVRVSCGATDTFTSVWRRAFSEVTLSQETTRAGLTGKPETVRTGLAAEVLGEEEVLTPDRVRRALEVVSSQSAMVVFVDEFDRLAETERTPFADLIKALSDYIVDATLVLVGVADDVDRLVSEHRSIERSLHEILMPRMSPGESRDIVERGIKTVEMTIEEKAIDRIVHLSKGLPHYTHLLAQGAAVTAAYSGSDNVTHGDVRQAIRQAIDKAQQTVKNEYHRAIYSPRPNNLYPAVLRACALADKDELGFFAPADVREPLSNLLNRRVDIPNYQQHLNAFSSQGRAEVLQRRGEPRRFRFRFRNPLLEPYVIMRGLRDDADKTKPPAADSSTGPRES